MGSIRGVLESVLYAQDLDRTVDFYVEVLGLGIASDFRPVSVALRVAPEAVFLIFNADLAAEPGRPVPSHGAHGPGHVALLIEPGDHDEWLGRLGNAGVAIEHEHVWGERGRSIYVRDPAGNSVELVTADIW
jgi:catechol 2,3-dioxygenase-like lactoylglutathione lyase family enzyme